MAISPSSSAVSIRFESMQDPVFGAVASAVVVELENQRKSVCRDQKNSLVVEKNAFPRFASPSLDGMPRLVRSKDMPTSRQSLRRVVFVAMPVMEW